MKWRDRSPRRRRETFVFVLLALLGALGALGARAELTPRYDALRVKTDVYSLPSPEQTVVLSLGYRAALADLLYVGVLVSYGQHIQERRAFEFVGEYLTTIAELDPKFAEPYRFADTFVVLQSKKPTLADYQLARRLFERGLEELPNDGQLWLTAGQYIAYLAPPHLGDPELFKAWRLDGARVMARACELVGSHENLPFQCITAATLYSHHGELEASERFLERVLAVNDDPEIQQLALGYLSNRLAEGARARVEARFLRLDAARAADLPFVSKDRWLVLGPPFDAAASAGRCDGSERGVTAAPGESAPQAACVTDWRRFSEAAPVTP